MVDRDWIISDSELAYQRIKGPRRQVVYWSSYYNMWLARHVDYTDAHVVQELFPDLEEAFRWCDEKLGGGKKYKYKELK